LTVYDKDVQRVCATLLLVLFGFPLIVPAVRADSENKLPTCCRREGKHHCGMANGAGAQQTSGVSARAKCPSYPVASAAPVFSNTILLNPSQVFFASIVNHPAVHSQTEALQRISFSRSRQKRGPPELVS
jgi:hypothetical protein